MVVWLKRHSCVLPREAPHKTANAYGIAIGTDWWFEYRKQGTVAPRAVDYGFKGFRYYGYGTTNKGYGQSSMEVWCY